MARQIRLGVIVPSSNTALEPLTSAIVNSITDTALQISVHFTRIRVTKISLAADSDAQFDISQFLTAARLLADAGVGIIGWSGTSAGWLGFDNDVQLCTAVEEEVGVPCTTSTLALNQALEAISTESFALVTPYTEDMNKAICKNYAAIGIDVPSERMQHLGVTENKAIARMDVGTLDGMVDRVVKDGAKVVSTFCTNLNTAQRVAVWEQRYGIVVFDTVSTVVWDMLRLVGVGPGTVRGWGKLFDIE